jgi:hypothetical protein
MPEEVTRNSILSTSLSIYNHTFGTGEVKVDDVFVHVFAPGVRRGLPQGSAASPIVAEMLLASLFESLPDCGRWVGYADNFLAMAKTKADAVAMTLHLWSALKAHPAGHFQPKQPRVFEPGQAIEFLGLRVHKLEGGITVSVGERNRNHFEGKVGRYLRRMRHAKTPEHRLLIAIDAHRYVKQWAQNFKLCTNVESLTGTALKQIDAALQHVHH